MKLQKEQGWGGGEDKVTQTEKLSRFIITEREREKKVQKEM